MLPRKTKFWYAIFCAMIISVVVGSLSPNEAYAANAADLADYNFYQGDMLCPDKQDGISGRIANCVKAVIIVAVTNFLDAFLPYYTAIVTATLLLATCIFGAMTTMGSLQRPIGQTMIFLLKLGAVSYFAIQFGGWLPHVFDIMDGLLQIVTNYVTLSASSACSDTGFLQRTFDIYDRSVEGFDVWDRVDCLFITLLGISIITTAPLGLGALMGPMFFTGGIGLLILFLMLVFIITLLISVVRALKLYLMSVITVGFLIAVSPLLIPLVLFEHTRPLFDSWLRYLANYIIIPIFLFAFLSMMVAGFDALLFRGTSSLYYAIAADASQEEDFSFKNWMKYGISGNPAIGESPPGSGDYVVLYGPAAGPNSFAANADEILVDSGSIVARDIPGTDAIGLIRFYKQCNEETDPDILGLIEETCENIGFDVGNPDNFTIADIDKYRQLVRCSTNPIVPAAGEGGNMGSGENCESVSGHYYYGFEKNEEILHFAIAPEIESDKDRRDNAKKKCGRFDLICKGKKALGAVVNLAKSAVGYALQGIGAYWQALGNIMKTVASWVEAPCRLTPIPGAVCAGPSTMLMVAGTVTHAAGTFTSFAGRVVINGLLAELGNLFNGWFDVPILDMQKIASYRCYYDPAHGPINDIYSEAWLECPGPGDIITEILYIVVTALVFAYLMMKWLSYVPELGKNMISVVSTDTTLPGEMLAKRGLSKIATGIEGAIKAKKGGGG